MNQDIGSISSTLNQTMKPQQFDTVVEAILAGKYSWACVLILRAAGYNPLHYIPYRTYNRLLKENSQSSQSKKQQNENIKIVKQSQNSSSLSKIKDLAYLEVVGKQKTETRHSNLEQKLAHNINEYPSIKSPLNPENTQDISLKCCGFH